MSGCSAAPWRLVRSTRAWQSPIQIEDANGLCITALDISPLHDNEANARLIAAAPELLSEIVCNQAMVGHVTACIAWFRENHQRVSPEELQIWTENVMSCVAPRKALNAAAIAKATQP